MDTLRIQQLDLRYRLPPGHESAADRLDRVLGGALGDLLEAALLRAGVPVSEEICLREVAAPPLRINLQSPDVAVATEWARAFAMALMATIERGGDGVVRYRTRHQALLDLVARAAEGDLRRAWAWRRLGLWPEEGSAGGAPRLDAFAVARRSAAVLARHPQAALGVLRELARRGRLPAWWARLDPASMRELARAVLLGSGAGEPDVAGLLEISAAPARPAPSAAARGREADFRREAARALTASPLGRALPAAQGALEAATTRARRLASLRALAILALEDAAPGFARSPRAGERLAAVEALALGPPSFQALPATPGEAEEPRQASRPRREEPVRRDQRTGEGGGDEALASAEDEDKALASAEDEDEAPPAPGGDPSLAEAHALGGEVVPEPPAFTSRAGVLFLLNVIGPARLHEAIAADPVLAGRGLRWALHALAMSLAGAEAEDPAPLAFAGLPPAAPPPSRGAPPPADAEREALAAHAAALTGALRERLEASARAAGGASELCARGDAPLLDHLCRRRGVVVADPGWLEVRLDLDEVSVELRRAGLDLDPGWLPWLGAVVRFTYA